MVAGLVHYLQLNKWANGISNGDILRWLCRLNHKLVSVSESTWSAAGTTWTPFTSCTRHASPRARTRPPRQRSASSKLHIHFRLRCWVSILFHTVNMGYYYRVSKLRGHPVRHFNFVQTVLKSHWFSEKRIMKNYLINNYAKHCCNYKCTLIRRKLL